MDVITAITFESIFEPDHYPLDGGEWFDDSIRQDSQDSISEESAEDQIFQEHDYYAKMAVGQWYNDTIVPEQDSYNIITGEWYEDTIDLDVTLSASLDTGVFPTDIFEVTVNDSLIFGQTSSSVSQYTFNIDGTRPDVDWIGGSPPAEENEVTFGGVGGPLTIRRPIFGDTTSHGNRFEEKRTQAGHIILTADSWPQNTTLQFTFIAFSKDDFEDVQTFLEANLGLEVTLTFYNGKVYTGYFINPRLNARINRRTCGWDFDLEFKICFE